MTDLSLAEKVEGPCPLTEYRLYRTPYLVVPRLALQAMPREWRDRLEALLKEADEAGIETPEYTVLRSDPAYTRAVPSDPDDIYSDPDEYFVLRRDEWADYRRGDAAAILRAKGEQ